MAIIDEIEDEGVLEEQERDLVKSALEFDETVVDEIITHRVDVIAVDVNEDIETVKETFINEEYSRLLSTTLSALSARRTFSRNILLKRMMKHSYCVI